MDDPGTGDETTPATRPTRFSDVCGTIDELKRLLHEEPAAAALLDTLVDEALLMEARMEVRLHEYEQFRDDVAAITAALPNRAARTATRRWPPRPRSGRCSAPDAP